MQPLEKKGVCPHLKISGPNRNKKYNKNPIELNIMEF
jgi:hypothetical protein